MKLTSPTRNDYWSSGGSVMESTGQGTGKPMSAPDIRRAMTFYDAEAGRCLARPDVAGALFCRQRLVQLGDAMIAAGRWNSAGRVAA